MNEEDNKQLNLPQREEKILEFWEAHKIFEETLKKRAKGKRFVFYEGPPTANGKPGIHHVLARAFKDVVLRYKTMQGFFVPRRAGWDTQGLPVEVEIEKKHGFKMKQDIESYGIAEFNKEARKSVWKYKDEWEQFTKRIGFWLDLENPYITYETLYQESLWAIIKKIDELGYLFQDFKVMPWCPRCETGLSSHEVGQGYKKVKDNTVFVKFPIKGKKDEYLLVWTTTPWTLPANVAIAVNPKLEYTKYKISGKNNTEYIWSAKTPPYREGENISVMEKTAGVSLKNIAYEPLYQVPKEYLLPHCVEPPFFTIAAEFVSDKEGTGMVHLAPAFGEEDMQAMKSHATHHTSQKNSDASKLYPILHTVFPNGTMKKGIIGEGKFVKDADRDIIEDLEKRGLLYTILSYEHEYPFCWRCATPLLYFARQAWWVRMSSLRERLLKNNETIHWIPEHIRNGRFGEFLKEVRDWAFSRERFWGTTLPVWICDLCGWHKVIGSIRELEICMNPAKNKYFIMRHGESLSNIKHLAASDGQKFPLSPKGKKQALHAARLLRKKKIDIIIASPVLRAHETAKVVADVIGIKKVHTDERLREIDVGIFDLRDVDDYHRYFRSLAQKFEKPAPEGESLEDVRMRVALLMNDLEEKYTRKNILLVSHEYPLWMLYAIAEGCSIQETLKLRTGKRKNNFVNFAEVRSVAYRNIPRDNGGEINLHRPYVDEMFFPCKACKKGTMRRVKEVVDVWFDSGAMPFAQDHWMRDADKIFYPADYICEAVDQTRGWFYSLLSVGILLGKSAPYRTVISLGHVLDKNGQKMSKSKGNVVDPNLMMQKYGADALRWYFYTINPPGEQKCFDEKDLFNALRNFHGTFWNIFMFFETYVDLAKSEKFLTIVPKHILDRWIYAKFNILLQEVTKKMEHYDIVSASRTIEDFTINDLSQWYLRRSRRRFQHPKSKKEKDETALVLGFIVLNVAMLSAPFIPFLSEALYQKFRKRFTLKEASIHMRDWPHAKNISSADKEVVRDMEIVRTTVAEALKIRAEAGIKIRQPLRLLRIRNMDLQDKKDLLRLIQEEVNVKEVVCGDSFFLDTTITEELHEEGIMREIIRNIQEMRKDLGLHPRDSITIHVSANETLDSILDKWGAIIKQETLAKGFTIGGKKIFRAERELMIDSVKIWIGIS